MPEIIILRPKSEFFSNTITAENRVVEKTEITDEGTLMWFKGHPFPEKTQVFPEAIYCINPVKRMLANISRLKWRLSLLIGKTDLLLDFCELSLKPIMFKPEFQKNYCQMGREISNSLLEIGIDQRFADTALLLMEYDTAYRYRLQDLFGVLNKSWFLKHPIKEVLRICKEAQKRENNEPMKRKWEVIKWGALLLLIPSIRKKAKEFISRLNLNKVKLDQADFYWAAQFEYYNYSGAKYEDRLMIRLALAKTEISQKQI